MTITWLQVQSVSWPANTEGRGELYRQRLLSSSPEVLIEVATEISELLRFRYLKVGSDRGWWRRRNVSSIEIVGTPESSSSLKISCIQVLRMHAGCWWNESLGINLFQKRARFVVVVTCKCQTTPIQYEHMKDGHRDSNPNNLGSIFEWDGWDIPCSRPPAFSTSDLVEHQSQTTMKLPLLMAMQ
jgi:hypothetical protein